MITFPSSFVWGAGTAAYQIEGAADADGKGESIWDRFCRDSGVVEREENALLACDHYHRYAEDVALMKQLGLPAYRFSISWPRLFPDGKGALNEAGLAYYQRLVDALLAAGIAPWVTLYHWDLPQALEDAGGWPARDTAEHFAAYASTVARALGDRVRHFITINEPRVASYAGYRFGGHAPGVRSEKKGFQAAYHFLLAHGLGYEAIKAHAPAAKVGLANFSYQPLALSRDQPNEAAQAFAEAENNGIFLDPVVKGTYPAIVLERLGADAPAIRPDDLKTMNRYDFLGVQYYKEDVSIHAGGEPAGRYDFFEYTETGWPVTPIGLYHHLRMLKDRYQVKEVVVTENGSAWPDVLDTDGRVRDPRRLEYLRAHLGQVHRAIADGVPVTGYFVWSLLDNFEWTYGYRPRFGIVYTDFSTQRRYIKNSGYSYSDMIRDNGFA